MASADGDPEKISQDFLVIEQSDAGV